MLAAAPFNSGLLALEWPGDGAYFDYAPAPAPVLRRARAYATACRHHGTTLPHAAVAFPLRHPAVASVVTGMGSAEHARSAARWAREPLPAGVWNGPISV